MSSLQIMKPQQPSCPSQLVASTYSAIWVKLQMGIEPISRRQTAARLKLNIEGVLIKAQSGWLGIEPNTAMPPSSYVRYNHP